MTAAAKDEERASDIPVLAARLHAAESARTPVEQLTRQASMTVEVAYAVQRAGVELRTARGDSVIGFKLGFTSVAKARQMGVSDIVIGVLTAAMMIPDGGVIDAAELIHPRVEPEIAFRVGRADEKGSAITHVAPALEIIDSRYRDFKFTLEDVVADNTSAARFVVGPWTPIHLVSGGLANLGVVFEIDDRIVDTGSTGAILGDPTRAVSAAARLLRSQETQLESDSILLAGAATAAHALPTHDGASITATVAGLGRVVALVGSADA